MPKFDDVVLRVCEFLYPDFRAMVGTIARKTGINPKTVKKYVNIAASLGIFDVGTVYARKRTFTFVSINKEYKKIYEQIRGVKA